MFGVIEAKGFISLVADDKYPSLRQEANDLGHGAAIEKQTCRGLDTGPDEPKPLGS